MILYPAKNPKGYIALLATISISLVLLTMVAQKSFVGWAMREGVLGKEAKEQASSIAYGCIEFARASLLTNPTFGSGTVVAMPLGMGGSATCEITSVDFDTPLPGQVTITAQAIVRESVAVLRSVEDFSGTSPSGNPSQTTVSWTEIP